MSGAESEGRTPEERRASEAIGALPSATPDPEFRARLRQSFVEGTLTERAEPIPIDSRRPRRWVVGLLAAAAVLVVVFLVPDRQDGPPWELAATGEGRIQVGEENVAPSDFASLRNPPAGATIRTEGEAQVDLTISRLLAVQVAPGTEITFPSVDETGRNFEVELRKGEVRFATGDDFPGTVLTVWGPAASVEVLGTTLAVLASPCSTCVCVLEGEVEMTGVDGATVKVVAETRRTVFNMHHEPLVEPIYDMERMKLQMLRDQSGPVLKKP